jgi:protein-serine/threonine kinase
MTPIGSTTPEIAADHPLHREDHLAAQRGFVHPAHPPHPPATTAPLPTPPSSNRSITDSDGDEIMRDDETPSTPAVTLTVRDQFTKRTTQYKQIRPLGQGTFSKVVLATKQKLPLGYQLDENSESRLDPKKLAAIKIVEHGPAGGADEERMELSLRREVDIMRSLDHPSLIDLRGYSINEEESLLVLGYCPGGDLFDLAAENSKYLKIKLVQRIFAELVSALQHLHSKNIVHRDVKLESKFPSRQRLQSMH